MELLLASTTGKLTCYSYLCAGTNILAGDPSAFSVFPSPATYPFIVEESATSIEDGAFGSTCNIFASRHRMSSRDDKSTYDNAGGNIGFLDGHVLFFRAQQVMNAEDGPFQEGVHYW